MRKKVIVGNWKMNHTKKETLQFLEAFKDEVKVAAEQGIVVGIAPTYLSLETAAKKRPRNLIVAAQNVNEHPSGAYTGEVSLEMIKEIKNVSHVIIGHSERRSYYNESNASCNAKMKAMQESGLLPIYCVGETLAQFEANETKKVVSTQIQEGLDGLDGKYVAKMIIAYEPVWSIGTGKNASSAIAEDICGYIRKVIRKMYGKRIADKVIIQYGGSVKPNNVAEYLAQENVDGALVGGASLKAETFKELIQALYQK